MNNILKLVLLICVVLGFLYIIYNNSIEFLDNSQQNVLKDVLDTQSDINNKPTKKSLNVYYTNLCGYSRQFLEQLDDGLENKLKKNNIDVVKIDCEKNSEICKKEQIHGYPTLKVYTPAGGLIPYDEERDDNNIINFISSTK